MSKEEQDAEFDRLLGAAAAASAAEGGKSSSSSDPPGKKLKTSERRSGGDESGPPGALAASAEKQSKASRGKGRKDADGWRGDGRTSGGDRTGASWQKPRGRAAASGSSSGC